MQLKIAMKPHHYAKQLCWGRGVEGRTAASFIIPGSRHSASQTTAAPGGDRGETMRTAPFPAPGRTNRRRQPGLPL